MGFFDDALKNAVPGGDLATPIAIAAGALLLHHFMGGSSAAPAAPPPTVAPQAPTQGGFLGGGGLLGGLSDVIGKLEANGHGQIANSWVGNGANLPIQPGQLGNALGQQTISELAAKAGISEQELLNGLSAVLPQLINNLTPNGRLPTAAEVGPWGR